MCVTLQSIFTNCAVYLQPRRASQNKNNKYIYTAISHTNPSTKLLLSSWLILWPFPIRQRRKKIKIETKSGFLSGLVLRSYRACTWDVNLSNRVLQRFNVEIQSDILSMTTVWIINYCQWKKTVCLKTNSQRHEWALGIWQRCLIRTSKLQFFFHHPPQSHVDNAPA